MIPLEQQSPRLNQRGTGRAQEAAARSRVLCEAPACAVPSRSWGPQGPVWLSPGSPASQGTLAPCHPAASSSVRLPSHSRAEQGMAQEARTCPRVGVGFGEVAAHLRGKLGPGMGGDPDKTLRISLQFLELRETLLKAQGQVQRLVNKRQFEAALVLQACQLLSLLLLTPVQFNPKATETSSGFLSVAGCK